MFCKMNEVLGIMVDEDSTIKEVVAFRAGGVPDEEGDEGDTRPAGLDDEVPVPSRVRVCWDCDGEGKHSRHLGVFSGRRLEEAREDEEFWDDYISGRLDRGCETCGGTGRVRVPNKEQCSPELLAEIEKQDQEEREHQAESAAERRFEMGAAYGREEGWYD